MSGNSIDCGSDKRVRSLENARSHIAVTSLIRQDKNMSYLRPLARHARSAGRLPLRADAPNRPQSTPQVDAAPDSIRFQSEVRPCQIVVRPAL